MTKFIVLLSVYFLTLSCQKKYSQSILQSLELAGDNRDELEKVLRHYEEDKNDSLKLKAAMFLIENMKYHSSDSVLTYADSAFLKIKNIEDHTDNEGYRSYLFGQI